MEVEVIRANNGGNLPYCTISHIVDKHKHDIHWLNKNHVNNYLKKKYQEQKEWLLHNNSSYLVSASIDDPFLDSQMSALTESQTGSQPTISFQEENCVSNEQNIIDSAASIGNQPTWGDFGKANTNKNVGNTTSASIGRPKGSTLVTSRNAAESIAKCKT